MNTESTGRPDRVGGVAARPQPGPEEPRSLPGERPAQAPTPPSKGWRRRERISPAPEEGRGRRLASSVRVPWAVGLATLLILAAAAGSLFGRTNTDQFSVPDAILDYQESITKSVAQAVRKSLNEGVYDLSEFALTVGAAEDMTTAQLASALEGLQDSHSRYTSLYVLEGSDTVLVSVGGPALPQLLRRSPPYDGAGMQDARLVLEHAEAILQFAPVPARDGASRMTVIGVYDPEFLRFSLQPALPGDAWIVNSEGQVLAGLDRSEPFSDLPSSTLRAGAKRVGKGQSGVVKAGGSIERQELVGYSPVTGLGPAGQLGWAVITARSVSDFALPQNDVRRQAILIGVLVAVMALLAFGWLYAVVISPVIHLQREAERLSYGDLSKGVSIARYDEIGLAARALERIRILLIRKRLQGDAEPERKDR